MSPAVRADTLNKPFARKGLNSWFSEKTPVLHKGAGEVIPDLFTGLKIDIGIPGLRGDLHVYRIEVGIAFNGDYFRA